MKRLFVAVPLQADERLMLLVDNLKNQLHHERINWVNPSNIHLTLKFIGETSEAKLPEIIKILEDCICMHPAFTLDFDKTGIFGSRYEPRIIWLGVSHLPKEIGLLAEDVLNAFDTIGFVRDRQNFVPHLTLGRIKGLIDKPVFQQVISQIPQKTYLQTRVSEVVLYESILRKEGPLYLVQQTFKLKNKVN